MSNSIQIGKVYYHFDKIDSTNDYARHLLSEKPPPLEGTVVRADFQTAGQGQMGNRWFSLAGCNFLGSIILYPRFLPVSEVFYLNQMAALAVFDTVRYFLPRASVQVKWPNDVLINHRKVAGILIQNAISQAKIDYSIVGIGLNINQLDFPATLTNATSLSREADGYGFDVQQVESILFLKLENWYAQIMQPQDRRLIVKKNYLDHLKGFGAKLHYRYVQNGAVFQGIIRDVSDEGKLLVELTDHEDTSFAKFHFKEIEFIHQ